jgi:dipeptidyl aminopeptidase/acylaminoacyl peptidase
MTVKDDETTDVFDSDGYFSGYVFLDLEMLTIFEDTDDDIRAYVADFGEEADRMGKGTGAWISTEGAFLLVVDEDDEETSFTLVDLAKDDEDELFTVEDMDSYQFSPDGTKIAYVINSDDDEQELHLYDIDAEEDDEVENDFNFPDYGFTMANDLFYVVEDDDGDMEAFMYGNDDAIAEGTIMVVQASPAGDYIITVSGEEEDDMVVNSYNIRKEDSVEIMDGENLYVAVARDPEQLFISSFVEDDLILYAANMDGSDLVEILDESDVNYYSVRDVLGHPFFYLTFSTEDGITLLAYEAGSDEEAFVLLEEWDSIDLLNVSPDGRTVLLAAAEDDGDDEILISIEVNEDADEIELDDDHEVIYNAVFTENGREIIFTASDGYDPDEISVNIVPADGDDSPEELYSEASLLSVQWADMEPFDRLYFSSWIFGYGN